MGDSLPPHDDKEAAIYKSIRSRPVTPARVLKVNAGQRERKVELSSNAYDPVPIEPCSKSSSNEEVSQDYGLQILGCSAPGISERPLSAITRLGKVLEKGEGEGNCRTTTDEFGDVMEMTDNFQKLKIARNQMNPRGSGDGPMPMSSYSLDDMTASANGRITIKSLSSNAVVVVPETHRSSHRPTTAPSSGEEVRIYPAAVQKSKLSKARRRRRIPKVGGLKTSCSSTNGFYPSLPDEGEEGNKTMLPKRVMNEDSEGMSDVGGSDQDYSAPSTAMSTMFDEVELMRPETASSEILADGALASEEELQLNKIMKVLGIHDSESWYAGAMGDTEDTVKSRLRQLTKLFYRRFEKPSTQGMLYTYKLMLGGLHNRLEDFVLLPVPPGFNLKTRITRVKKGVAGRLHPIYYLHLEREGPGDRKCLLLVAKKNKHFRGIGYVLSTDPAELTQKSEYCVGKIDSNFIGTEFTLYSGRSICTDVPLDKGALMALPKVERFKEELTTVLYDPNVLGFKGPRKIKVIIPKMKNLLERETVIPRISEETLLNQYQNEKDGPVWCLKNKDPIWSRETHSYILNFAGRVNTASVKNFQIVSDEDEDHIMLQFGRASENSFSLDFQYPFCPLQAFAVALTSFDSKLACE